MIVLSRTVLSAKRQKNIIPTYLGRILLFCEGMTEKQYLEYFSEIIRKNKFNDIKIEGKDITSNIGEMNPFTNMHLLIEQLMAVIS